MGVPDWGFHLAHGVNYSVLIKLPAGFLTGEFWCIY